MSIAQKDVKSCAVRFAIVHRLIAFKIVKTTETIFFVWIAGWVKATLEAQSFWYIDLLTVHVLYASAYI